jgi:hypothetical protein
MEQQQSENQEPGAPSTPGQNHERGDAAELLIDKTKQATFNRHASLGREFAKRGREANLQAGQHYFQCQQMLKYKSKGTWFENEAEAIGVDVRTIYNFINLAKVEIERQRWVEILKNFQNLPPAEQEVTVANAREEANRHNQKIDKKKAAAKAREEKEAKQQKDLDDFLKRQPSPNPMAVESEHSAPVPPEQATHLPGGGSYTLRFDFMTEAMRNALDVFVTTQNWHGAQKDLIAVIARILNQHGLGSLEDLLKPTVSAYHATDGD